MPNNLLDQKSSNKVFSDIADEINKAIREHLKNTEQDSVKFSIGMFDFDIKAKKEIDDD